MSRSELFVFALALTGCASILGVDFDGLHGKSDDGTGKPVEATDATSPGARDAPPVPPDDPAPISVRPDGKCPDGYHRCSVSTGQVCASDRSVLSCGTSCDPCKTPEHATGATCANGACGFTCEPGFAPSGSTCESATTTTCYRDADGDGYGVAGSSKVVPGTSCPTGYTDRGAPFDCDDESPDAHPGQTAFFEVPHGNPSSFDYDCNGTVTKTTVISDASSFPADCHIKTTSSCAAADVADDCRCLLQVGSTSCGTNATGRACLFADDFTACVQSGGLLSVDYVVRCH